MRTLSRSALAGTAGVAAMGASTALEMRLRGREASGVPAVLDRALEATELAVSLAHHAAFAVATRATRAALGRSPAGRARGSA
jgi:hypothetical protein